MPVKEKRHKRFYDNYTKVEPFLPDAALVVQSQSSRPGYFTEGLILLFLGLAAVYGFGYIMFLTSLYPAVKAPRGYEVVDIESAYGRADWLVCQEDDLEDQLYNVLSGYPHRGFNGRLVVGNENLVNNIEKEFVFVPDPGKIPGHFTVEFLVDNLGRLGKIPKEVLMRFKGEKKDQLKKKFKELDPSDQTVLLLDLCGLKEARLYLAGNRWAPPGEKHSLVLQKIQQLKEKGVYLLYRGEIVTDPDKKYLFFYAGKEYKVPKQKNATPS